MLPYTPITWKPAWIAPSLEFNKSNIQLQGVLFRTEFSLPSGVKSATLHIIGLGHYRAYLNGKQAGNEAIGQPWSQYDKRIYETAIDVTKLVRKGTNAIGVSLGNSFWRNQPAPGNRYYKGDSLTDFSNGEPYLLSAELVLKLANGAEQTVETDSNWQWHSSPVTLSQVMGGEDFDARLVQHGWDQPKFLGAGWQTARLATAPGAAISPTFWPAFAAEKVFHPAKIVSLPNGDYTYIFPQNSSSVLRYTLKGAAGQVVTFIPSETKADDDSVTQPNLGGRVLTYGYTLAGSAPETHTSLFQYFGFQYVQVHGAVPKGAPNPNHLPVVESLSSVHVQTANPEVGAFKSSNTIFNGTNHIIRWAMRSNMSFVFTDCPTREKLGWLETSYLLARSLMYQWNCEDWLQKICVDMHDAQLPDGTVLTVAPSYLSDPHDSPFAYTVEWGAASVQLPWEAYKWYGNIDYLRDNYPMMKGYVDNITSRSPEGIAPGGLGDWYDYTPGVAPGASRYTPTVLSATASYAMCIRTLIDAAEALGNTADADRYRALFSTVQKAFWAKFYNPTTREIQNNGSCQVGSSMALYAGLVPSELRQQIYNNILDDLESKNDQQTAGDIGQLYFIRALAEGGYSSTLFKVYERDSNGSYGGILRKGLTTMPEAWDARTNEGNSLNHAMLGHIMEWFYGWVAGIRQASGSVGWKSIVIGPQVGNLKSADADFHCPLGLIASHWSVKDGTLTLHVTIPKGAKAVAELPAGCTAIQANGHPQTELRFPLRPGSTVITAQLP